MSFKVAFNWRIHIYCLLYVSYMLYALEKRWPLAHDDDDSLIYDSFFSMHASAWSTQFETSFGQYFIARGQVMINWQKSLVSAFLGLSFFLTNCSAPWFYFDSFMHFRKWLYTSQNFVWKFETYRKSTACEFMNCAHWSHSRR